MITNGVKMPDKLLPELTWFNEVSSDEVGCRVVSVYTCSTPRCVMTVIFCVF